MHLLPRDGQVLTARCEDPSGTFACAHRLRDVAAHVEQMLAIVEHDDELALRQERREAMQRVVDRLIDQSDRGRDRIQRAHIIGHRREIDETRAIRERRAESGCHLDRQPRLATSAHTGERDHPVFAHEPAQLVDFGFTAHERGHRSGQLHPGR